MNLGSIKENDFKESKAVAIAKNIIRKNRTQYFFGKDLIGNGIDDVIVYLQDKKNQDIKLAIMNEIKSK